MAKNSLGIRQTTPRTYGMGRLGRGGWGNGGGGEGGRGQTKQRMSWQSVRHEKTEALRA